MSPYRNSERSEVLKRVERSFIAKKLTRLKRKWILLNKEPFNRRYTRCYACNKPSKNPEPTGYYMPPVDNYDCGHTGAFWANLAEHRDADKKIKSQAKKAEFVSSGACGISLNETEMLKSGLDIEGGLVFRIDLQKFFQFGADRKWRQVTLHLPGDDKTTSGGPPR
jgi:hypothetical protein